MLDPDHPGLEAFDIQGDSTTRAPVFVMREQERLFGRNLRFQAGSDGEGPRSRLGVGHRSSLSRLEVGCVARVVGLCNAKGEKILGQVTWLRVILGLTGMAMC